MIFKNKLWGSLIFIYRLAWVSAILYLFHLRKSYDILLLVFACGLIIDGTAYNFFIGNEEARIKIGTSFFTLEIPQFYTSALIAAIVILAMYYGNIKEVDNAKDLQLIVDRAVSKILPENLSTTSTNKSDKDLVIDAEDAFQRDDFEACNLMLDKIKTADKVILQKKAYLRILCLYKYYENQVTNFVPIGQEKINELDGLFKLYLQSYKENANFTTVYYFYGQFQRTFRSDKQEALHIFEDIVTNYWYSNWIQGSLYYSALLRYELGDETNKQLAIERLKILSKQDGALKIFETGMTVDASTLAKTTLMTWGVLPEIVEVSNKS